MIKKKGGMIDYGLLGVLSISATTVIASLSATDLKTIDTAATSVAAIADKNPLLACIYIMAVCLISVSILAWNIFRTGTIQQKEQLKEMSKQNTEMAKLNVNLERVVNDMNSRPCIYEREKVINKEVIKLK